MAVTAIVRVSFQSVVEANQAVNKALVGVNQGDTGPGPFAKAGTAVYCCSDADSMEVANAISELGLAIGKHGADLDYASINIVKN